MPLPPVQTTEKPKLSKAILKDHNILFSEGVHNGEELDGWLLPIRDRLIRLRRQLPKDAKELFIKELEKFRSEGQDRENAFEEDWSLTPPETPAEPVYFKRDRYQDHIPVEKIDTEIIACRNIAKEARLWRTRNDLEPRWTDFFQKNFFRAYYDVHNHSTPDE
jgi:hypothetical protein